MPTNPECKRCGLLKSTCGSKGLSETWCTVGNAIVDKHDFGETHYCQTCEDEFKNEEQYDPKTHTCGKEAVECMACEVEAHVYRDRQTIPIYPHTCGKSISEKLVHKDVQELIHNQDQLRNFSGKQTKLDNKIERITKVDNRLSRDFIPPDTLFLADKLNEIIDRLNSLSK